MHCIRKILVIVIFSLPIVVAQDSKPLGAQLRVRWDGFNLMVVKNGVKHPLPIAKDIRAYALDSVKLLSAKESGDETYFIFDVTGRSRGPEATLGQCGAGKKRSLIWMKLDAAWNKVESQSFAIESCWDTAQLDDEGSPLTFSGPDLVARGTTFRDPSKENSIENYKARRYELKYSIRHPENGLRINLVMDEPKH